MPPYPTDRAVDPARILSRARWRIPTLCPDGGRPPAGREHTIAEWETHPEIFLPEIAACIAWITAYARRRVTINSTWSSYGLKHVVEEASEAHACHHYVCNGAFIAAAVGLGYRFAHVDLNMYFAMGGLRYAAPRVRTGEQRCTICVRAEQQRQFLEHAAPGTVQ